MSTATKLRNYIERIERLNHQLDDVKGDIKLVYDEAKADGFDTATLRKIIALRKMEQDVRRQTEQLLEDYKAAIGMD
jgi:uncharacterized protein (UPF0335 family)